MIINDNVIVMSKSYTLKIFTDEMSGVFFKIIQARSVGECEIEMKPAWL